MQVDSEGLIGAGRRFDETYLHFWYRKNAEWLYFALALAVGGALWFDASEQKAVSALVATFDVDHRSACANQYARLQTVLNFWNDTSGYRESHAAHELDASTRWSLIVGDLAHERVGDAKLRSDVNAVAVKWRQLAADDYGNAKLAHAHVRDLEGEYDKACGIAGPTPRPAVPIGVVGHD